MAWNLGLLGASSAGEFDPTNLNPDLWLDASDASTITESGGSVSQWDNKGTLENFSQATSADQPTTGVSTLNGLNVIDFNDSSLEGSTKSQWKFLHDGTTYFIASAFRPDSDASTHTAVLASTNDAATNNVGAFIRGFFGSDSNSQVFISNGGSVPILAKENLFTTNEYFVFSALIDPDNATALDRAELFKNNDSGLKSNTRDSSPSSADPTINLKIGSRNASRPTFMKLAELIIVSGADATETNRQAVVDYLNTKWGVF